jgi:L-2-hydroxyglutarate oxidase LhgO
LTTASPDAREYFDAVVIGAGFYGSALAAYLLESRGFKRILVLEQEREILSRASRKNQARVHNGYHYPRSFTTAFRSRVNLPRFLEGFSDAVETNFTKLYAIARQDSKISPQQFERFCSDIGAPLEAAAPEHRGLFNANLVSAVYVAEEYVFDADSLSHWASSKLTSPGIELRLSHQVTQVEADSKGHLTVHSEGPLGAISLETPYVFNCAYSGLNHVGMPPERAPCP